LPYAILLNNINDLSLLKSRGKNRGRKKAGDFCLEKNLKCLNGSGANRVPAARGWGVRVDFYGRVIRIAYPKALVMVFEKGVICKRTRFYQA
jgi:hypothetical protein